jgi:GNAT superfamily N-acetyltransferase
MGLPAGYGFRAPTREDLEAVAGALVAEQVDVGGQPVLGADFVRKVWSRPDIDLEHNAWVVTDSAGVVVAYGQVTLEGPDLVESWGVVDPASRGRGIGSSVFDRIDARAAELLAGVSSPRFRSSISAGDLAAAELLASRGLRPVRHFWHMQVDLEGPVEAGPQPEEIEIRGIDPSEDLPAIHAVLEEAFAEDWGHRVEPFDRWVEEELGGPGTDPALWLVAQDAGTPVAVVTAGIGDEGGWVDYVAVLASHRGRGIAQAMLRRTFGALGARGASRVLLNVDAENPTGETALYERVGMRVVNRWDLWERSPDLAPNPP